MIFPHPRKYCWGDHSHLNCLTSVFSKKPRTRLMGEQDKVNEFSSPLNVHEAQCSSLALPVTLTTSCSSPWWVSQIPESRSVYVVSVPVRAQNQTKGRQSGEEELGWRTQASHGCQAKVKMQAQDVSFWLQISWRLALLIYQTTDPSLLWTQLDFLPVCLFWAPNKKHEGEERRHLLELSLG